MFPRQWIDTLSVLHWVGSIKPQLASIARLAPTALPAVLTDAGTPTLLALTALPAVLTHAGAPTLLTLVVPPSTLTDAGTRTLLTHTALPRVCMCVCVCVCILSRRKAGAAFM